MEHAQSVAPFLEAFQHRAAAEAEPSWLKERREDALLRFAALGFPKRRHEAWRFTDVDRLTGLPARSAAQTSAIDAARLTSLYQGGPTHRIVLVNGHFEPALSSIGALPDGVFLGPTSECLKLRPELVETVIDENEVAGAQPFASLNAALFADGFVLVLDPDVELDIPVEIIHFGDASEPCAFHIRNAIWAASGSKATIIETSTGAGAGWTNMVSSLHIGEGAEIRHVKIQNEAADAVHLALTRAALDAGARYDTFLLALGARLSRQDIHVAVSGEAASTAINGAYLLRGDQEATFAPFVDHTAPGCQTKEVVKGLVQDRAHGVFLGKMAVRPGADQTDAHQLNQNLLLSREASVDTKPELEIFADEVKCSHGATVGDLDETALFYLQARGIREADARHMLMEAFVADVIETAELGETIGAYLRQQVRGWFERAEAAS